MSVVNNFLPFCPNDNTTNLESQSAYAADSNRSNGNQPGVASSPLNNKALRQGTYIAGQFAQFISDTTNQSVLDNATPAQLLAQIVASLKFFPPVITSLTTGTGTMNLTYIFTIATGSATDSATYSDGVTTYTVTGTVSSAKVLKATGSAAPVTGGNAGTLTKTGGTGDATITYYAVRAPVILEVLCAGGGGGGGGGGSTPAAGSDGSDTTFGASGTLLTAKGGKGGPTSTSTGADNTPGSIGASASGFVYAGGGGGPSMSSALSVNLGGGVGGGSLIGGGAPSGGTNAGVAARANSGGGGSGGAAGSSVAGGGGNGGEGIHAFYSNPTGSYAWAVGAGGAAGTGGTAGGAGGSGKIIAIQHYQ